jgi:hypothetical protein
MITTDRLFLQNHGIVHFNIIVPAPKVVKPHSLRFSDPASKADPPNVSGGPFHWLVAGGLPLRFEGTFRGTRVSGISGASN